MIEPAQSVPYYLPTEGLVGWWPFNENANDESGNGNDGVVNGATLASDRFGQNEKAYFFDGVSDDIGVNLIGELDTFITLSFWLKTNQTSKTVISFDNISGIYINQDSTICMNEIEGDWGVIPSLTKVNDNEWKHVVVLTRLYYYANNYFEPTVSGINNQMFIDGVLKYELTPANYQENISQYLQPFFDNSIGASLKFGSGRANRFVTTLSFFNGFLDDIAIYNRALSPEEITALFISEPLTPTTIVAPLVFTNAIKAYPNPARSALTIEYSNFKHMNGYKLRIENSLGQQVFQTNITQQTDYLSLNNWGGNGLYFVHIIDDQGNTIDIRKIVLQ
jgi:hypothetical protein